MKNRAVDFPETIGRYKVLKHVASGGMAEVLLAKLSGPVGFEKLCIIKRILGHLAESPDVVRMFVEEARLAARLIHPAIGQIYELGQTGDGFFLAMEYVPGENLAVVRKAAEKTGNSPPPFFVARVACQVLEALDYAHTYTDASAGIAGIVHRDVTPHNILISYDGHVKLVDFGIAKAVGRVSTAVGRLKGKFGYLSPEQLRMEPVDGRSDLFSLGVAMYELIAGAPPFEGETPQETLARIAGGEFKPLDQTAPGCPVGIVATVHRALAARLEDRYASAREMLEALETAIAAERLVTTSAGTAEYMRTLFESRLSRARHKVSDGVEPTIEVALASLAGAEDDSLSPATRDLSPRPAPPPERSASIPTVQAAPVTENLGEQPGSAPSAVFGPRLPAPAPGRSATLPMTQGKALVPVAPAELRAVSSPATPREGRLSPRQQTAVAFVAGALAASIVIGLSSRFSGRLVAMNPSAPPAAPSPVDRPTTGAEPRPAVAVSPTPDSRPDDPDVTEFEEPGSTASGASTAPTGKTGTLVVRNEGRAVVYVDGRRLGLAPQRSTVASGEHWVEVRSGGRSRKLKVTVVADRTKVVTLRARRR